MDSNPGTVFQDTRFTDKCLATTIMKLSAVTVILLSALLSTGWAETIVIPRQDGSDLSLLLEMPPAEYGFPILLFIDGSGCGGAARDQFRTFTRLPEWLDGSIATLVVEKPGVAATADGSQCSETFAKYYSQDQRVLDHLRAFQYLRRHVPSWNGKAYVLGWSEGASIGVSVSAYTPEVNRAAFGGLGGGISMARQFEDYMICSPDRTESREDCISNLRAQFDEIRSNPSPEETWLGADNSYRVWATRLDGVEFNLISDFSIPILIVHGSEDRDSVPVEAARELIRLLEAEGEVDFEYWEVPEMGHGLYSMDEDRSELLRLAMLDWLFERDPRPGGPPDFGSHLE